jgi:hypothetical protein
MGRGRCAFAVITDGRATPASPACSRAPIRLRGVARQVRRRPPRQRMRQSGEDGGGRRLREEGTGRALEIADRMPDTEPALREPRETRAGDPQGPATG